MLRRETPAPPGRAVTGIVAVAVTGALLVFWWLGWYPGFVSVESMSQWEQVASGDIANQAPATYTVLTRVLTRVWRSPAMITLLQILVVVALLWAYTRACRALDIPGWACAVPVLLFGLLPGPASATVSFDGHTAQALAAVWLFVEMLRMAGRPAAYMERRANWGRLATVLALVALFDHAGVVTVFLVFLGLAIWLRGVKPLWKPLAATAAIWIGVQTVVFGVFGVDRTPPPLGEAFAPEIAAVLEHSPGAFSASDLRSLEEVASMDVWSAAYRCGEGIDLVRDRDFSVQVIRDEPATYRALLFKSVLSRPHIVVGHRLCAMGTLFLPAQPQGERFEAYTYSIPQNSVGLSRDTISQTAFNTTKAVLLKTDRQSLLWLFWRPGILVWLAIGAYATALARKRWRLAGPALAFGATLAGVALTITTPSFAHVFPVYALALLSLPMWWRALLSPAVSRGDEAESDG